MLLYKSKEFLLQRLRDASELLGHSPGKRFIESSQYFPGEKAYRLAFGSWAKALSAAGLPPAPLGAKKPHRRIGSEDTRDASLRLRFKIFNRDSFRCAYCGATVADGVRLVVDHITPASKGGKTTEANLTTACDNCNLGKGDIILNLRKNKTPTG